VAAKAAVEAAGGQIVGRETAEVTATNLTTQVIALKNSGADGILAFQFPNPLVVFFNQAAENGLNVPIFGGSSAALAIQTKNVKSDALKNVWGSDDCVPVADTENKVAQDFVAAYKAKYNSDPNYAGAEAYDSIYLLTEAAKKAGKIDKKAIATALSTIDWQGACEHYKADAGHGLHHSTYVENFDSSGKPSLKKRIDIPAPAGGG
jgi:branched-chain amino acid transport system substrate-binding protein